MTLLDLEVLKDFDEITYIDLIGCDEWKIKRKEILRRDNCKCTLCAKSMTGKLWIGKELIHIILDENSTKMDAKGTFSKMPSYLEVHHEYYVINRYPWRYKNDSLSTLCRECHQSIHDEKGIQVWDENMMNKMEFGICKKCSGEGYISEYHRIQGGICFKCGGSGHNIPFTYKKNN